MIVKLRSRHLAQMIMKEREERGGGAELQRNCKQCFWQVYCAGFSSDGTLLASGSLDSTVRLWDPSTVCIAAAKVGVVEWDAVMHAAVPAFRLISSHATSSASHPSSNGHVHNEPERPSGR